MRRLALLFFAASLGVRAWDVNEDLLESSRSGDLATVQSLIAKGAALEAKTAYGQTPLYLAAMNGREEVVRYLLQKGAARGTNVVWKAEIPGLALSSPIVWGDRVYVTTAISSDPTQKIRTGLYGDTDSATDLIAWSKPRGGVYLPSPIVYGDRLYTLNNNGILTAYDALTGNPLYQQRLEGDSFVASPVAAAGNLYFASEDGDVFVVKAGAQFGLVAKNPIGEPVLATPAWADDLLIVRGAQHLFAIAEKGR